jgi:hypothetical protein
MVSSITTTAFAAFAWFIVSRLTDVAAMKAHRQIIAFLDDTMFEHR